ncbi:hypothetical protein EDD11_006368 [Mortierella claussenii]|nr:hypothetical protein EDD11_006368 [Mortierella claussenii]
MDPTTLSFSSSPTAGQQHPVIDTLEKTRLDHHEEPFPHSTHQPHPHYPHPLDRVTNTDVVDQVLQQSSAIHVPESSHMDDISVGVGAGPRRTSESWQSLASKSSNQLPSKTIVNQMSGSEVGEGHEGQQQQQYDHEHEHDKPSVLPEILPGFKNRMADIHHSVSDGQHPPPPHHDMTEKEKQDHAAGGEGSDDHGKVESKWTGGTMFPGLKAPFSGNSNHSDNSNSNTNKDHDQHSPHHRRTASEEANRKLAKSSILYESSDLEESTTKLTDDNDEHLTPTQLQQLRLQRQQHDTVPSKTLVQGGQGGRRWSHELSPEKAGLVGSVIQTAGLIKDMVLDKIQQHPKSPSHSRDEPLSAEEKVAAAKIAFGGAEETGDHSIYLEGLDDHLRAEAEATASQHQQQNVARSNH